MRFFGSTVLFSVLLQALVREAGIIAETLSFVAQLRFVCGDSKAILN